jgi:hypothetical protein
LFLALLLNDFEGNHEFCTHYDLNIDEETNANTIVKYVNVAILISCGGNKEWPYFIRYKEYWEIQMNQSKFVLQMK